MVQKDQKLHLPQSLTIFFLFWLIYTSVYFICVVRRIKILFDILFYYLLIYRESRIKSSAFSQFYNITSTCYILLATVIGQISQTCRNVGWAWKSLQAIMLDSMAARHVPSLPGVPLVQEFHLLGLFTCGVTR